MQDLTCYYEMKTRQPRTHLLRWAGTRFLIFGVLMGLLMNWWYFIYVGLAAFGLSLCMPRCQARCVHCHSTNEVERQVKEYICQHCRKKTGVYKVSPVKGSIGRAADRTFSPCGK
ncbi:MAG: hypothetical protein QMC81_06680 [Thermoanaerobacterales bacterium]|nr:hypothetical protein [Thermoanaerobacterales bacterium]